MKVRSLFQNVCYLESLAAVLLDYIKNICIPGGLDV